jgi:hypothetical protein
MAGPNIAWAAQVQSSVADLFGQETLSDCTVDIVQEGEPVASAAKSDPVDLAPTVYHSIPAHRMTLQQSGYIRSYMQRWSNDAGHSGHGSQQLCVGAPGPTKAAKATKRKAQHEVTQQQPTAEVIKPVLRLPVASASTAAAALEVIRFMYAGCMAPTATAVELLAVRQQADYLVAQHCMLACDEALASLELSWDDALAVFGVLGAVRYARTDVTDRVAERALQALLQGLGDGCALATYTTPALLERCVWLPVAAVEAVLASDKLRTDSEVSLLARSPFFWYQGARGRGGRGAAYPFQHSHAGRASGDRYGCAAPMCTLLRGRFLAAAPNAPTRM